ncbi:glycosyltransferase [Longimicrobium terrae]|uniref:Glycosyltransferase involved in cell wall biosynthesis n=1 Tax=Longimicrobium terrae TaxID=1639882 RepID=A0A841GTT2_9BACT|nr:glycosyltransferase involved in cell wall biosynthesis [Longimicrobium terrae]MBB6068588.1 glycosyltransferase involved in cell wall biosynthesis [Longimicrobium terrae]NNC27775.1 glycosyltransferase [Longimicrobium terrae]
MSQAVPTVLALLDHYLPGYKAGGPVRSVHQLVTQLGGEFRFRVVTRDRDAGDTAPYPGVPANRWQRVGRADVLYLSPDRLNTASMRDILTGTPHDLLYLNSLFSPRFSAAPLLLRRLNAAPSRRVVLAPRGELHPSALGTGDWGRLVPPRLVSGIRTPRYLKKQTYLRFARSAGLFRGITWQASTEQERIHIQHALGAGTEVVVAPDLVPPPAPTSALLRDKRPGDLRVVFLSRLCAMKNLRGAAEALRGVRGPVRFDIYGPVDDARYWEECRGILEALPPSVTVRYMGPVPHDAVAAIFRDAHLLLLPTLGENFGHVILEALSEGCPVLISDQTPWRELTQRRAGWDLPLADIPAFTAVLEQCLAMDAEEFGRWSAGAAALARAWSAAGWPRDRNRALFGGPAAADAPEGAPARSGGHVVADAP